MARKSRQSFLKRQRELRRNEKAALKRRKREERRRRAAEGLPPEGEGEEQTAPETGETEGEQETAPDVVTETGEDRESEPREAATESPS